MATASCCDILLGSTERASIQGGERVVGPPSALGGPAAIVREEAHERLQRHLRTHEERVSARLLLPHEQALHNEERDNWYSQIATYSQTSTRKKRGWSRGRVPADLNGTRQRPRARSADEVAPLLPELRLGVLSVRFHEAAHGHLRTQTLSVALREAFGLSCSPLVP